MFVIERLFLLTIKYLPQLLVIILCLRLWYSVFLKREQKRVSQIEQILDDKSKDFKVSLDSCSRYFYLEKSKKLGTRLVPVYLLRMNKSLRYYVYANDSEYVVVFRNNKLIYSSCSTLYLKAMR